MQYIYLPNIIRLIYDIDLLLCIVENKILITLKVSLLTLRLIRRQKTMLDKFGSFIEKKPWIVIGVVLMITIGFGSLIPFLDMGTSTEEFMPDDDEVVNANVRVGDYFGGNGEMLMIYVEKQTASSVVTPDALKEEYFVLKSLEEFDEVDESICMASFVDMMCQVEFGDSLLNCSNDEISTAYQDLMKDSDVDEIQMMNHNDPNEEIDYAPFPKIFKGKKIDSMDVKNYYIKGNDDTLTFSIEAYDLSHFESQIKPPHLTINVMEWYVDFENLITPDERLDIDYKISAHIEPTEPLWEIGDGLATNIGNIFRNLINHQLFGSFNKEVYLWIQAPGKDISFPIVLETGNVSFNTVENRVEIEVNKEELGKYGVAPRMGNFGLPAKLGNTKAGVRVYKTPIFNMPWSRVTFNVSFIQNFVETIQNRPVANAISTKILNRFTDFSWEDFDELFSMLDESGFAPDKMALKDMNDLWITTDEAPDTGSAENSFFIKPHFLDELKTNVIMFLSEDYAKNPGPSATLMMVQMNGTIDQMELGVISEDIVLAMEKYDSEENYVTMKATGSGVISYQTNELTEESNKVIAPGIFIVICFILIITFRKFSYMILPLVSLSISIIWLFGTMVLLGMNFNVMAVALVPLLMGLGVDYSVHMLHNYRAELKKGKKPGKAIAASIKDVGMAMFLATITTIVAFLSFLTASIPPLRDFGILCAIGIGYTFIMTITLQAAVRFVLDRKKEVMVKPKPRRFSLENTMRKLSGVILEYPKTILFVTSIVTIVMVSGAVNIQTTFNMEDFLPEDNPAMEIMMDISEKFPSASQGQEYILIEGNVASVDTLKGISETSENIKDDDFVTRNPNGDPKVTSMLSIIRSAAKDNTTLVSEFNLESNGIPKSDKDVKRLYDYLHENSAYMMDVRSVLHQKGNSYDATVIRIYSSVTMSSSEDDSSDSTEKRGILYDDINEDMTSYGDASSIVTGDSASMYTIINSLTESQIVSTIISVILAGIVLIVVYRNPILGLIVMLPVLISILWILGTMYFIGYSLNIMTIMITSLTIGLGIDYAIHATQRFRLSADKTGDVKKAVSETIGHTGGALLISALTTAAGFGILILAPMPPEQQFGVIIAMTIAYSFITSIFVLPPVLMFWGNRRKKRRGYIISTRKYKSK